MRSIQVDRAKIVLRVILMVCKIGLNIVLYLDFSAAKIRFFVGIHIYINNTKHLTAIEYSYLSDDVIPYFIERSFG
jgi:hypothetical protein